MMDRKVCKSYADLSLESFEGWTDGSSYSRGEERVQTCWTRRYGKFGLTVVRGHIYHPNDFVGHIDPNLADTVVLGPDTMTPKEAQAKLRAVFAKVIEAARDAIHEDVREDPAGS